VALSQKLLADGLAALGNKAGNLKKMPKGAPEKTGKGSD
jgi:hypothetical protein